MRRRSLPARSAPCRLDGSGSRSCLLCRAASAPLVLRVALVCRYDWRVASLRMRASVGAPTQALKHGAEPSGEIMEGEGRRGAETLDAQRKRPRENALARFGALRRIHVTVEQHVHAGAKRAERIVADAK